MRLAIVGSRGFSNYNFLKEILDEENIEVIVSGGAKGADQLAERYANEKSLETNIFYPDWKKHGKQAGFVRNKEIVDNCDKLIAFWDGKSKGTNHSVYLARNKGKEVKVIKYED